MYSDWQNLDSWQSDMPGESGYQDPLASWDVNRDNLFNVTDIVKLGQSYGYDQDTLESMSQFYIDNTEDDGSSVNWTLFTNQFGMGPANNNPQLSLDDLKSYQNLYQSSMSGQIGAVPLQDYEAGQFGLAEQTLRDTYAEDYNIYQTSLASSAYDARVGRKGLERTMNKGYGGLSTGRREKAFSKSKETYTGEIEKLRNAMETKREAAMIDIMAQRQGYMDELSSIYGDWSSTYMEDDWDFKIEEAQSCMDQGGIYMGDGTCDIGEQYVYGDPYAEQPICGRGTTWCEELNRCVSPNEDPGCPSWN